MKKIVISIFAIAIFNCFGMEKENASGPTKRITRSATSEKKEASTKSLKPILITEQTLERIFKSPRKVRINPLIRGRYITPRNEGKKVKRTSNTKKLSLLTAYTGKQVEKQKESKQNNAWNHTAEDFEKNKNNRLEQLTTEAKQTKKRLTKTDKRLLERKAEFDTIDNLPDLPEETIK